MFRIWSQGWRASIVERLLFAFGAILLLFAVAAAVVLAIVGQLESSAEERAQLDAPREVVGRVTALVREQYMHQAHTIIETNRSHLDRYLVSAKVTREAIQQLRELVTRDDDRATVDKIAELVRKNDVEFMSVVVPTVDTGNVAHARALHAHMEESVDDALDYARDLGDRLSQQSRAARHRSDILRDRVRWMVLACFLLSAAIAVIVGWRTTRWISNRVSTLRTATEALGAGARPSRIMIEGSDEFAEIARSVEDMARDLARTHTEVIRAQKLASIGQVAAGVAHEINNPLGIILGYVKTMKRREGRDDEGLEAVEAEATQCRRIVQGLLDLARPERLSLEPCDLAAIARDTVARLEASGKLDSVKVDGPRESSVTVCADAGRLRQVLVNVIANAIEASPPGSCVEVDAEQGAEDAVLSVRDHGEGLPDEVRTRLFEPFVTTKKGGVGLGLAIAHAIVDAHHGSITCESPPSGGTLVRIRIPRGAEGGAA